MRLMLVLNFRLKIQEGIVLYQRKDQILIIKIAIIKVKLILKMISL